jgi:uncharacterized glyoxalase superfamily protein PhnB
MTTKVQAVPADYGTITPYFVVHGGAERFIEFLKAAFEAKERGRVYNEDGTIGHAEVWIGDSVIQMFDAKADWLPAPNFTTLYVEDCDVVHGRALQAGAISVTELSTNAWGDRGSRIRDPFGNIWWIQTHVEDVSQDEMVRRMGEPAYIKGMQDAQETLDRAMPRRK